MEKKKMSLINIIKEAKRHKTRTGKHKMDKVNI